MHMYTITFGWSHTCNLVLFRNLSENVWGASALVFCRFIRAITAGSLPEGRQIVEQCRLTWKFHLYAEVLGERGKQRRSLKFSQTHRNAAFVSTSSTEKKRFYNFGNFNILKRNKNGEVLVNDMYN